MLSCLIFSRSPGAIIPVSHLCCPFPLYLRWRIHESAKREEMYQELPFHACFVLRAKVGYENICAFCNCLEDQFASFIVTFNVSLDRISDSWCQQPLPHSERKGRLNGKAGKGRFFSSPN